MSSSGVNYYLQNYASFDYQSNWKVWFNFKNVSGSTNIPNISGANPLYSGLAISSDSLPLNMFRVNDYMTPTTGQNGGVKILPITGLWSNNFSLIFLNKKESIGKGVIFNSIETGLYNGQNIYRGYRIGYTDSNKPFFEYYTNNGLECLVADFNLPTIHSLNFVKSANSLSIGYYDFLKQKNNVKSFGVNSSYFFEPTGKYQLGYDAGNIADKSFGTNLSGSGKYSVDEFLYFTSSLYDYDIQIINSGFISDYVISTGISGYLLSTGVTGYITGNTTIFSGITGYGITGTGYVTNDFGVQYTGYLSGAMMGVTSGSGIFPLTGLIYTPNIISGSPSIVLNTGYIKESYNSGISFLSNITKKDVIDFVCETGHLHAIKNSQIGVYDIVQKKFKIFDNNPPSLFLNGQLVVSGQKLNNGDIYTPIWSLTDDFYNTGSYVDSLSGYSKDDFLTTFNIGQQIKLNYKSFSDTGNSSFANVTGKNLLVFLNGAKLNSGDYQFSSNNLVFPNSLYGGITSGILVVLDVSGNYSYYTGNLGSLNIPKNNPYYSQIYLNGQKITRDFDYLPISPFSLLNASGIFTNGKHSIYNDSYVQDSFWN